MAIDSASLTGRRILVTGASRGIGAATASLLVSLGATVIRIARSPLQPLANSFDYRSDLADARDRDRVLRELTEANGVPDGVVSNAGAFMIASLEDSTDALLREQLAINLEAPFAIARHFLPAMRERGHGTHIIIGSVADTTAYPGNAAYAASKFAVRGFHEVLCAEYRGTGVRCTLISPGPTDTAVWDPIDPDHHEGFTPRADMLCVGDVANAVVYALTAPKHVQVEAIRLNPA